MRHRLSARALRFRLEFGRPYVRRAPRPLSAMKNGADSEEKHEPASDIDTVAVDSLKVLDPNVWTRRALQEKAVRLGCTVLHQCIRPRIGAHAPDHHGNPRASDLINGHASKGSWGHQFSGALVSHFSMSSVSLADLGGKMIRAYIAFLLVLSGFLV